MANGSTSRTGRRVRLLVLIVGIVVVGVGGWFVTKRFKPQWYDVEDTNAQELSVLKTAPLTLQPIAAADRGWPQWFGPNRDGRAPTGSLRTDWKTNPPKTLWSSPCGGGYSSLAVVNGRVYSQDRQGNQERVLCWDAESGKELWSFEQAADYGRIGYSAGPRATPTIHDGRLYSVGATGTFLCLQLPTDKEQKPQLLWQKSLATEYRATIPTWGMACSPLIEEDLVIVQPGGKSGSVVAFDRITGDQRWAAGNESNGYSSPIVASCAGVRQVIAFTGESLLGIRAHDGHILWRYPWLTEHKVNSATPVVVGDYLFISSSYGKGCALLHLIATGSDGVRAEQVYFRKGRVMMNHHSTCVFREGFLYGYDGDRLKCVNLREGEEVEEWDAAPVSGNRGKGCVILVGEYLIGLTQTGSLFLADANSDQFRLHAKLDNVLNGSDCWALPVFLNGRIYLRDAEKILCLDVAPGK